MKERWNQWLQKDVHNMGVRWECGNVSEEVIDDRRISSMIRIVIIDLGIEKSFVSLSGWSKAKRFEDMMPELDSCKHAYFLSFEV